MNTAPRSSRAGIVLLTLLATIFGLIYSIVGLIWILWQVFTFAAPLSDGTFQATPGSVCQMAFGIGWRSGAVGFAVWAVFYFAKPLLLFFARSLIPGWPALEQLITVGHGASETVAGLAGRLGSGVVQVAESVAPQLTGAVETAEAWFDPSVFNVVREEFYRTEGKRPVSISVTGAFTVGLPITHEFGKKPAQETPAAAVSEPAQQAAPTTKPSLVAPASPAAASSAPAPAKEPATA